MKERKKMRKNKLSKRLQVRKKKKKEREGNGRKGEETS